jgi:hypothetical protein
MAMNLRRSEVTTSSRCLPGPGHPALRGTSHHERFAHLELLAVQRDNFDVEVATYQRQVSDGTVERLSTSSPPERSA